MNACHPPFLSVSGDDEDDASPTRFYALAFCEGRKMRGEVPSENVGTVYLTIYFTASPDCRRFGFHTVERDGKSWAYQGIDEGLETIEYMLLTATETYGIRPANWSVFPASAIPDDAWRDAPADEAAYAAARRRFCRILCNFRIALMYAAPTPFRQDPKFVPPAWTDDSAESQECFRAKGDDGAE